MVRLDVTRYMRAAFVFVQRGLTSTVFVGQEVVICPGPVGSKQANRKRGHCPRGKPRLAEPARRPHRTDPQQ